jgi:bacterial/archaeal transporter family-2 protein
MQSPWAANLALVAGALLTVQASANLQLKSATGSAFTASTLQLAIGTFALLLVASMVGATGSLGLLHGVLRSDGWWHVLGGFGSAAYVTATILVFPRLGAVASVGLTIVGQMLASLALDVSGAIGVPARPMAAMDLLGAIAVIAAAAVIVTAQSTQVRSATNLPSGAAMLGWSGLAVAAGAVLPVQGAVNALLRGDLGAPIAAGTVSFVVATLVMAIALLSIVVAAREPAPHIRPLAHAPWWAWLGGVCGAVYVTSVFTSLPVLGAAVVVELTVAGQQIGAVLFDRYGLLRLPRRPVTTFRLAGVGLLLGGVILIQFG